MTFEERFWSNVKKRHWRQCWLWQASCATQGYGQIGQTVAFRKTKNRPTHRVAWELTNGTIPRDLQVLHKCDVRKCCNPHHLYLGTHRDNMKDRDNRDRGAKGQRQGSAKLTEDDVREIRLHYAIGKVSYEELGMFYDVGPTAIANIIKGRRWGHVA